MTIIIFVFKKPKTKQNKKKRSETQKLQPTKTKSGKKNVRDCSARITGISIILMIPKKKKKNRKSRDPRVRSKNIREKSNLDALDRKKITSGNVFRNFHDPRHQRVSRFVYSENRLIEKPHV